MKGFKGVLSATLNIIAFLATTVAGSLAIIATVITISRSDNWLLIVVFSAAAYACVRTAMHHLLKASC